MYCEIAYKADSSVNADILNKQFYTCGNYLKTNVCVTLKST